MNLDEAQKSKVVEWIGQGLKLSEIQSRLGAEFGLRLTYMDVRLLVDDLKLTPKDPERAKPIDSALNPAARAPTTPAPRRAASQVRRSRRGGQRSFIERGSTHATRRRG